MTSDAPAGISMPPGARRLHSHADSDKLLTQMPGRRDQISLLLTQLESCRAAAISMHQTYALEETIRLVESLRSAGAYLRWLADRLPGLDQDRLLELNELLHEWDQPIHEKLLQVERDRWPAFIRPLVERLAGEIAGANRPMTILDVGSGSMEIVRQVIVRLRARRSAPVTFVAVDESPIAHRLARRNMATLAPEVELIDADLRGALEIAQRPSESFRIIFCHCRADAISALPPASIDILFHSFMRHHLTSAQQQHLDALAARVARQVFVYDGYYSRMHLIPLSILTWRHPAFLAASLFSHARFPMKAALRSQHGAAVSFFRNGCYLATR